MSKVKSAVEPPKTEPLPYKPVAVPAKEREWDVSKALLTSPFKTAQGRLYLLLLQQDGGVHTLNLPTYERLIAVGLYPPVVDEIVNMLASTGEVTLTVVRSGLMVSMNKETKNA